MKTSARILVHISLLGLTAGILAVNLLNPATSLAAAKAAGAANVVRCPNVPADADNGFQCAGKQATCVGTDGNDLILGTIGADVIYAGAGDDIVNGDSGNDIVCGGPGNDHLLGGPGRDKLYGEEGDDWLFGAKRGDLLDGGPGDFDVLWGGPGKDKLDGGPGQFDVCLLQKEMGDADAVGCNTVYPPPGYVHDEEPEPGILKLAR